MEKCVCVHNTSPLCASVPLAVSAGLTDVSQGGHETHEELSGVPGADSTLWLLSLLLLSSGVLPIGQQHAPPH